MIRLAAFCDQEGGWSRHALCFAAALDRLEPTVVREPGGATGNFVKGWIDRSRLRISRDSVGITLGAVDRSHMLDTRYRIVFSAAETTRIPQPLLPFYFYADMVWTMSAWGRELLERHQLPPERIRVVPAGVDPKVFAPASSARPRGDVFRFLCIGKWEERKGNAGLVRAFAEEFDPCEPVELVMHCGTSWTRAIDYRQEIARLVAGAGRSSARIMASDPLRLEKLVELMRSADTFVLPTRGEAWGLPVLEAMACGLPCIVTDYSGPTEFLNRNNGYPIRVEGMCKAEDPEFFHAPWDWGMWAQPDLAHLRSLMRFVYRNPEDARRKGQRAREDAVRCWTWDLAAEKAMAHIHELRHKLGPRRGKLAASGRK